MVSPSELATVLDALREAQVQQAHATENLITLLQPQPDFSETSQIKFTRILDNSACRKQSGQISHPLDDVSQQNEGSGSQSMPLDFRFHYDTGAGNMVDIMNLIQDSLASQTYLHDWDDKVRLDPLPVFVGHSRLAMIFAKFESGSYIVANSSSVDRVCTRNGANRRMPVTRDAACIREEFFPPNPVTWPSNSDVLHAQAGNKPGSAFGRVIFTKETIPDMHRAVLLCMYAFCIRLQDEDHTFIRSFIRRHLEPRSIYVNHTRLQDVSPSQSPFISYKRTSFSFHLDHIILDKPVHDMDITDGVMDYDRRYIGLFQPYSAVADEVPLALYKASTSVLLTLAVPEPAAAHEEDNDLLANPETLWTVLVINAPTQIVDGFRQEQPEHLTPLAQFIRGICITLVSQRIHLTCIFAKLKLRFASGRDSHYETDAFSTNLFDDKHFSKSELYHWIIKTCHELSASVESNLGFVQGFKKTDLGLLQGRAHDFERHGVEHWSTMLTEEMSNLERTREEVMVFREQVRELRDALHGATALLEGRAAVKLGEKVQILTYVALLYLPVSTVASLYSMSVLPHQANLASFFVVLAIFVLVTAILVNKLQHVAILSDKALNNTTKAIKGSDCFNENNSTGWGFSYLLRELYSDTETRTLNVVLGQHRIFYAVPLYLFVELPMKVFVDLPKKQTSRSLDSFSRPSTNSDDKIYFSFIECVFDIIRVLLLPLWISMGLCGVILVLTRKLVHWMFPSQQRDVWR